MARTAEEGADARTWGPLRIHAARTGPGCNNSGMSRRLLLVLIASLLVAAAAAHGQEICALTDRDGLYGAVRFAAE